MQMIVDSMMKLKQVDVDMVLSWYWKMCLGNDTTLLQRAAMEAYISLRQLQWK